MEFFFVCGGGLKLFISQLYIYAIDWIKFWRNAMHHFHEMNEESL